MDLTEQIGEDELRALTNLVVLRAERLSASLVVLVSSAGCVTDQLLFRHQARLCGAGAVNEGAFNLREC